MIGAALVTIGALVAISALVAFLTQVTGRLPTDDHSFSNNHSTTVHLDAGATKSIYYTNPPSGPAPKDIGCSVRDNQGRRINVARYNFDFIPTSQWRARFHFHVKDSGNYAVSCTGPSNIRYGVGDYVGVEQFAAWIWAIVAGIALAIAGFATFIVTTVRRV